MPLVEPAGFFLARTPLLPVDAWHAWAGDHAGGKKQLDAFVQEEATREALELASRSLLERAQHGEADQPLARYLTRMSTRCTPFATHAGVSLGRIAEVDRLELSSKEKGSRRHHLDLDAVERWLQGVVEKHRERLVWRRNPTLRRAHGGYRFMTRKARADGGGFAISDSFIEADVETEKLLSPKKEVRLVKLRGRRLELANALIRAQVLVSDLFDVARVTNGDPVEVIEARLAALGLEEEREALRAIDARVDLVKPHNGQLELSRSFCEELGDVMLDLARMQKEHPSIGRFRDAWRDKYGEREVAFEEAIDPETGIFATLDNLPDNEDGVDAREVFLQRKLVDLATLDQYEWKLTNEEATKLFVREHDAPSRMELLGVLFRPKVDDREKLAFVFSRGSGIHGSLLGRFTRLGSEFAEPIRAHLQEADTLCADIDVQPGEAMGGATSRVAIHPLRVSCFDDRSAGTIHLSDLRVKLHRGRLHVFSARLSKRIELRLTQSHAFWSKQHPRAYRLLGHLARQPHHVGLAFPWGRLRRTARHLPRVSYRESGHVLSPAQWTFDREEVVAWFATGDEQWLASARQRYAIPRYVLLTSEEEGDNRLAIDLESPQSLAAARAALPKSGDVTFVEAIGIGVDDAPTRGPEGAFATEVVVPFCRRASVAVASDAPLLSPPSVGRVRRIHPPGSGEWTYVRLYCGPRSADRVLATFVKPFIASLKRKLNDRELAWFFLRDGGPDDHLRVRVRTRAHAVVLDALGKRQRAFARYQLLQRTTLDTYEREIERYGGEETIEAAEELFAHDSEASLRLLCDERRGLIWNREARFLVTLRSLSRWYRLLPLSNDERLALLRTARMATWKLLGVDADYEGVLSKQFRARRGMIELALAEEDPILAQRDQAMRAPLDQIARVARAGRTTADLGAIGRSIGHMIVSRMMPAPSRSEELALLDALCRHELSMLKRNAG